MKLILSEPSKANNYSGALLFPFQTEKKLVCHDFVLQLSIFLERYNIIMIETYTCVKAASMFTRLNFIDAERRHGTFAQSNVV